MNISKHIDLKNPKVLFWTLQSLGWIVCGFILFLSGLGHQSILSSSVRNTLFSFLGFALSLLLHYLYKKLWNKYQSFIITGFAAFILSYLCGVVSGLVLNPITFYTFHDGLGSNPFSALFAGVLNFALVFMTWSACYYAIKYYLSPLRENELLIKNRIVNLIRVIFAQNRFLLITFSIFRFSTNLIQF